jgi:outer membrane receptor for ferric coprogen and ferric-rhodotorulic acid
MKIGFNLPLAAVLSLAALTVRAQTAAPSSPTTAAAPAGDGMITLSPFVVDATKDNGYAATNTLAGSRLNSRLLDTPSAISVMTPELLQDIGAVNIDTAISFGTNTEVNRNDDNSGYRIRGITSSVSRSRNLFLVSGDQIKTSSDLYNIDRVTTSRGPNAILYGNADPAGVVDVSTKRADLNRNLGEFAQQVDSFNTGQRASVDWNQVIIPGRFALRFDGMYQDVNGFRMNSPQRDRNVYLTGTALLVKKKNYSLTATFDYENDNGSFNYMRVNQHTEQFSYWKQNGSPVVGAYSATVKPTYATGTKSFATSSQVVFIGGASVNLPTMDWKNSGVSNSPTIYDPNLGKSTGGSNLPLLDDSEFPLDLNLYGPTDGREKNNARYRTLSLTQQFGHDLFIEAAYNDFNGSKWRPWSSGGFTNIMIDPNAFLPNGAVNPNEGKYFIDRIMQPQDYTFIDSTVRVGVAYQLDLGKKTNNWVGKNNFALSYDHRKSGRYIDNYIEVNTTPLASAAAGAQIGAANYLSNSQNYINRRYYLDPASGVIAAGDVTEPINDNGVKGELLRVKIPTVTQGRSTSYSQALQSFWLKDHLVTTVGVRQDTADSYGISDNPTRDARGVYAYAPSLLGSAPIANFKVNTKSYGAVVHITDSISVFGNKSDNFSPDVTRTDVYGHVIPPTVGKGQDIGLKLQLFDGRLSLALGRYVNSKENTVITGGSSPGDNFTPIWQALGIPTDDPRYPGNGTQYNYTQSNESKGTELELTFNPTPNWRIRATADKNDTIFSSFAPQYEEYYNKYKATWSAADQTLVGGGQTIATSLQNIEKQLTLNHAQLASATLVTPYQANIITSYTFPKSSVLKNFFVGASQTYAAATIIGFPNVNTTDPTKPNYGQTIADTSRPYKGRDVYTTGLWLGYERNISSYGHKIKWRMQLNVNNVLDDREPIPFGVRAQDGAISNAQLRVPRQFVFRNSFSF